MSGVLKQADVESALKELGLGQGDIVLVHSSLASLGQVEGGVEALLKAFLGVIGNGGTLVVPTFGELGVLTKAVAGDPRAVKSVHPLAAVAAIGRDAGAICRDHWKAELAHGPDTPYTRIADLGGWVLLLGVDQDRNTTLHTAEELLRLAYLTTSRESTFETPEGTVTKSYPFFPGPHRDFIGIDALLRASGRMRVGRVGHSVARLIRSRDLIDALVAEGQRNPAWALCDNPACADCVKQRAALRRDRFSRESFRLAAGSRLAGRYVPEMIENLNAAGIAAVELDWVQGRPAATLSEKALKAVCDELRDAGIGVSALRVSAVSGQDAALLDRAKAAGIRRVLFPLTARAGEQAALGAERGIEISFFNESMTAEVASALLAAVPSPRFVFGAAAFAVAGEKPFLKSYKQKLRRFVDQLDVEDARFDGTSAPLARGNAEIKEMISILRCASFDGWLVLGSKHGAGETLVQVVDRLIGLLDRM